MKRKTTHVKAFAKITSNDGFLVIVESPSKIKKIEAYLGSNYQVIASCGHIRTLAGLCDIDIKNKYHATYTIIDTKKNHIENMRSIIRQYHKTQIILATDNDREGEAIAYHLCCVFEFDLKTTSRIYFNEITSEALSRAVSDLSKRVNMDAVRAQMARQIIDIIIGFKISPQLWKCMYYSKSKSLSAGRCQTPALRIIYDNEMEIKNNVSERIYKTKGTFLAAPFTIQCDLSHAFSFPSVEDELDVFLEKSKTWAHTFHIGDKHVSVQSSPLPYNTSRLLQDANSMLKYTPKQTTELAQKLYQEGHITYIRTEAKKYSEEFIEKAAKYIEEKYGTLSIGAIDKLSNKGDVLPHEAIRVTSIICTSIDDARLNTLYKMIWKNTVASCMSDSRSDIYKVTINGPCQYDYIYDLTVSVFPGWKNIFTSNDDSEKMQGLKLYLNSLLTKTVTLLDIACTVSEIGGKSHYSESGLIRKLEELGIGRPSTFSTFVETIIDKGYVKCQDVDGCAEECDEYYLRQTFSDGYIRSKTSIIKSFGKEKNKLVIQPIGIICIELLLQRFDDLFAYSYTQLMEQMLDQIVDHDDWWKVCDTTHTHVLRLLSEKTSKAAFQIDENHKLLFLAHGPCVRRNDGEYLPLKPKLTMDMQKVKNGEYTLDDLVEFTTSTIGMYVDKPIYRKIGQFGPYLEWGDIRKGCKDIGKNIGSVTLEDAIAYLESDEDALNENENENENENGEVRKKMSEESKTILRVVNQNTSIRKGKFGPYVFHKTSTMKKPRFTPLKTFTGDYMTCSIEDIIQWTKKNNIEN